MKSQSRHIIQKQVIEINFENPEESLGLPKEVAEMYYEKLLPQFEVLLDEMFGNNYEASLDKLEIDCGRLNKKNWKQEFTERAIRKLKAQLNEVNKKEIDSKKIEENAAEAFFFFIENGFMPWNNQINTIAELEQRLTINEKLVARLKKLITQKTKVAERLAGQFSEKITSRIIDEITKDSQDEFTEILSLLEKRNLFRDEAQFNNVFNIKHVDKHVIEAGIFEAFASDKNMNKVEQFFSFLLSRVNGNEELSDEFREIIQNQKAGKDQKVNNKKRNLTEVEDGLKPGDIGKKEKKESSESKQDTIYIGNAGLILLHPFLPALFENLEITRENNWSDESSHQIAVLVTEYLVTGTNEPEEFNLVLNKILCGLKPDETVITELKLKEEIKDECQVLLNEVITRWSVLKNTSIEGLRETFLQRNGKLSKADNGWLLQVEQKAVDILLNHLPWGIGIIKLPWMSEMLYVEWA